MKRLYMRTSAEAHMYMDQQPCTCGDIEFDRQSAAMSDGGVLCSRYFGKCRGVTISSSGVPPSATLRSSMR